MPTNSDMIKWAEQGRLHTKYVSCQLSAGGGAGVATTATLTVNDAMDPALVANQTGLALRVGQTIMLSDNTPGSSLSNKAVVTVAPVGAATTLTIAFYEATQLIPDATNCTIFVYGSEFAKGVEGMVGSMESDDLFFQTSLLS